MPEILGEQFFAIDQSVGYLSDRPIDLTNNEVVENSDPLPAILITPFPIKMVATKNYLNN